MGLSIAYRGRIKKAKLLPELIVEIVDIVKIYDWNYSVFNEEFKDDRFYKDVSDDVYGIIFSPPKCEPVFLTFLSNGIMINPFVLEILKKRDIDLNVETGKWLFTKTQYAGIEVHKVIIQLFRYISEKYLEDFELYDDSRYWETNNEEILEENFERYDFVVNKFSEALDDISIKENDDVESLILKLFEYLNKKFGDKGFDFES